jgi:hypothetical protein
MKTKTNEILLETSSTTSITENNVFVKFSFASINTCLNTNDVEKKQLYDLPN